MVTDPLYCPLTNLQVDIFLSLFGQFDHVSGDVESVEGRSMFLKVDISGENSVRASGVEDFDAEASGFHIFLHCFGYKSVETPTYGWVVWV